MMCIHRVVYRCTQLTRTSLLAADHPHFAFQPHLEPLHHRRLDRRGCRQHLGAGGAAVVDQHQGVALGHAGASEAAAAQTARFDQLRRRHLVAAVNRHPGEPRAALPDPRVAFGSEYRILEERAGVGQQFRIGELAAAQADDRPAHVGDRGIGNRHLRQLVAHPGVLQGQSRPLAQTQPHFGDQHPVAQAVLEDAVPVAERARGPVHGTRLAAGQRHRLQVDEYVGQLRSVGADVLDRRRAHRSRDQAEVLDAAPAARHRVTHQPVPVMTGGGRHDHRLRGLLHRDAAGARHDHDPGVVAGEQDIAAAAEHHPRQAVEARVAEQIGQLPRHPVRRAVPDAYQIARRRRHA